MASHLRSLDQYQAATVPDAAPYRFGIVVAAYHHHITTALLEGCRQTLTKHGATQITELAVPGAFELVGGAQRMLMDEQFDVIICLGCVVKGETDHDVYINHGVAQGILQLQQEYQKPVIFGLLTPNTMQQATDRAGGRHGNKGTEAAIAAIQMAHLYARG